ncbi:hypothetical protein AVEN_47309-1 [Araneus ventricosus]|uniref:Uncharacterized protein n=1 Tax=Araneus ventricosus TaxID=182803 RepID=A0A4Y2P087_ARAVE|nr:hypothetical protein AVEN_47309-1 [Araneus ventricosus]
MTRTTPELATRSKLPHHTSGTQRRLYPGITKAILDSLPFISSPHPLWHMWTPPSSQNIISHPYPLSF